MLKRNKNDKLLLILLEKNIHLRDEKNFDTIHLHYLFWLSMFSPQTDLSFLSYEHNQYTGNSIQESYDPIDNHRTAF